mgnify:CR=1 FL=1
MIKNLQKYQTDLEHIGMVLKHSKMSSLNNTFSINSDQVASEEKQKSKERYEGIARPLSIDLSQIRIP